MRKPANKANMDPGVIRARVLSAFRGVRDGEVMPTRLNPGDVIEGSLADAGISMGKAEKIGLELEKKTPAPVEKKEEPSSKTGKAKPPSSRPAGQASKRKTSTARGD